MNDAYFIKQSSKRIKEKLKEHYLFKNILLFVKDKLPTNINIENVISKIEKTIPQHLSVGIDEIFIGHFDEFEKMDINALYKDRAIYVTNNQTSEKDLIDDIIHELAHSLEETYGLEIYSDGLIEEEFLTKRHKLYEILKQYFQNLDLNFFLNIEYSKEFDLFLYKTIGYSKLTTLTMGLFNSPYAATSLREYFANGFEEFFINHKPNYLKKISIELFNKLEYIQEMNVF